MAFTIQLIIHPFIPLYIYLYSDTHSRHDNLLRDPGLLPPGDILLHAGDFTTTGTKPQIENFRDFLKTVPYAYKVNPPTPKVQHLIRTACFSSTFLLPTHPPTQVFVGGNHDITLHEEYYEEAGQERFHKGRPDGTSSSHLPTHLSSNFASSSPTSLPILLLLIHTLLLQLTHLTTSPPSQPPTLPLF